MFYILTAQRFRILGARVLTDRWHWRFSVCARIQEDPVLPDLALLDYRLVTKTLVSPTVGF